MGSFFLAPVVSKAFQVLSDADKRAKFDKFGGDPESRHNQAAASSPFGGFGGGAGASMFDDGAEISPEELFRQFFGGGMGPAGFPGFGTPDLSLSSLSPTPPFPASTFPLSAALFRACLLTYGVLQDSRPDRSSSATWAVGPAGSASHSLAGLGRAGDRGREKPSRPSRACPTC